MKKRRRYLIVQLKGGLGNQLFSYATARALALRNGMELRVDTLSGFIRDHIYKREYLLDRFAINAVPADASDCLLGLMGRIKRKWLRLSNRRQPIYRRRYLEEQGKTFIPEILKYYVCDKVWMEGYWQDQQYFIDAENELRREFRLSVPLSEFNRRIESEILSGPSIGVHVRTFREIPKSNTADPSPPPAYFEVAVREALAQEPSARIYCFGDDLEWFRANIRLPKSATFVNQNMQGANAGAPFDLWLLSRCRHLVLSNSTFSWWAAWLGDSEGKVWVSAGHPWPNTVSFTKVLKKIKIIETNGMNSRI